MKIRTTNIICWVLGLLGIGYGACSAGAGYVQDTSLLFVGEDDNLLTIASRREESAWQVPAVACVIKREEIKTQHWYTLADALGTLPGFHVMPTNSGIKLYLRGIQDSALILYDTVPLGSSTEKSLNLIDGELPLNAVKQVEVVRGPGSVLWGPDAFAGIVNVVPLTGKDFSGVETGMTYEFEKALTRAYVNIGQESESWDGFFSMTAGRTEQQDYSNHITRFFVSGEDDTPVAVEERYGVNNDYGQSVDVTGNFSYKSLFTVSGRFTDFEKPYTLSTEDVSWKEVRDTRSGFIKLEGRHQFDIDSTMRFTGVASSLENEKQVIDLDLDQKEKNYYGEITYEKTFNSGKSHLASGLSYRDTEHSGIPVWDSYLPDYLLSENEDFLPQVKQYDYHTRLWSVFSQYRMTINKIEFMGGGRYDHHDSYENQLSYNAGFVWTPSDTWVVKGLWGTAYRTPHTIQQVDDKTPELEEIQSINILTTWKPASQLTLSWCAFINDINNHVKEDPYAGLSSPNAQTIKGIELQAELNPYKTINISANATFLSNSGPEESFRYVEYYIYETSDSLVPVWGEFSFPYDMGPDCMVNLNVSWTPRAWISFFSRLRYFSSYSLTYPYAESYGESENTWLMDAGVRFKNTGVKNFEWGVSVTNVFDKDYMVPGTYSLESGQPFTVGLFLRKTW